MTVVAPPVITKQPTNKTVDVLQSVIFGCEAVGFEVRYEWRRHSSSSMFGNESILTISKVTPFDEDFYYCVAITDGGLVVSDAALLTVNCRNINFHSSLYNVFSLLRTDNIIIAMQPRNIMASSGSNITLSVTALGVKLKYHWKKRGHDSLPSTAAGRYTAHFNITTVTPADSGLYYCVIKNQWGAKLHSDDAILNVLGELKFNGYCLCSRHHLTAISIMEFIVSVVQFALCSASRKETRTVPNDMNKILC